MVSELKQLVTQQSQRIQTLETRQSANQAPRPVTTSKSQSGASATYLPEIGAVADIVGLSSEDKADEEGNDRISAREFEIVIGHDVDPYTRLDATVAFSDTEDPALEEAYATLLDLPFSLNGRLGKFRPKVGKASPLHRDSLETVDVPLVIQRYLGAEGYAKSGAELSGFLPMSTDSLTEQLYLGVVEGGAGEEGLLFGETRRRPTFYTHLTTNYSPSESANFELGGTYMLGSSDADSANEVNAFGVDATFSYHPTPVQKIKFQNEIYFQDRKETQSEGLDQNPYGFYSLLDYRMAERWAMGTRYDWVQPIDLVQDDAQRDYEQGFSAYLTFFQSEFARFRLQYQKLRSVEGGDDNRFFFQGTFAIGTHKHSIN